MLPVVQREVLLASRRGVFYRTRYLAGAAAGLGGLGALLWASNVWLFSSSPGRFLFLFTSLVGFVGAAFAGLFLTLDSLSREKREGTLGLLFLTELHGFDIVLGKFASAAATALSAFLTIFPIMALSVTLGGVTGAEFWKMCLSLLVLLFFSLCLGLFLSSLLKTERWGLLLFGAVLWAPTLLGLFGIWRGGSPHPAAYVFNPLYPAFYVAAQVDSGPAASMMQIATGRYFGTTITISVLMGFTFLVAASVIIPFSIRGSILVNWLGTTRFRRAVRTRPRRKKKRPVIDMAIRERTPTVIMWTLIALASVLWFYDPLGAVNPLLAGLSFPLVVHYLIKWNVAYEAGKLVSQERESGLLETLLTTPVDPAVILQSKRRALRRHFLLPVIVVVAVHASYIFHIVVADKPYLGAWIAIASSGLLFLDFICVSWLGMWQGLLAKNSYRAFVRTVFVGFVFPWLPFFIGTGFLWFLFSSSFQPDPGLFIACGFVTAAAFGAAAGAYAMAQAHFQLRARIAEG